jgi:hypothetical protein
LTKTLDLNKAIIAILSALLASAAGEGEPESAKQGYGVVRIWTAGFFLDFGAECFGTAN